MAEPLQQILAYVKRVRDSGESQRGAVTVLFAGPMGTGKTMAMQMMAHELGVDLLRIDLSQVVSKYIGETEKNLKRAFAEAKHGQAILVLDEADALFGKRSDVRDAHDRYANTEVAFLLQLLEEHHGVVILASNIKNNIDSAFLRRIRFVVDFPRPERPAGRPAIDAVKSRLLRYLIEHPDAGDTKKGIRDWWIQGTAATPTELAKALAELESEGVVLRSMGDGEEIWHTPKAGTDFTP